MTASFLKGHDRTILFELKSVLHMEMDTPFLIASLLSQKIQVQLRISDGQKTRLIAHWGAEWRAAEKVSPPQLKVFFNKNHLQTSDEYSNPARMLRQSVLVCMLRIPNTKLCLNGSNAKMIRFELLSRNTVPTHSRHELKRLSNRVLSYMETCFTVFQYSV